VALASNSGMGLLTTIAMGSVFSCDRIARCVDRDA
jgi:hypothetical protein